MCALDVIQSLKLGLALCGYCGQNSWILRAMVHPFLGPKPHVGLSSKSVFFFAHFGPFDLMLTQNAYNTEFWGKTGQYS